MAGILYRFILFPLFVFPLRGRSTAGDGLRGDASIQEN
jgi:hypothetical protein